MYPYKGTLMTFCEWHSLGNLDSSHIGKIPLGVAQNRRIAERAAKRVRSREAGFTRLSPDGRRIENVTRVRCTYPIVVVNNVQSESGGCCFSPEPREPPWEPHNPSAKFRVPCQPHSSHSAVRSAAPTLSRSQTAFKYSMVDWLCTTKTAVCYRAMVQRRGRCMGGAQRQIKSRHKELARRRK